MTKYIQLIKSLITEKNKTKALLIVFVGTFLYVENYAYFCIGYDYFKSYGLALMTAIVCRVCVNDLYEWYLGNRD